MLVFLGLLLAGGYPGAEPSSQASSPWLMNLLDEGRVVSGTSGAMSDREEIVWECSQTAPHPLTTHSERTTEREDVRARMDGLKMIEGHRLTLTNRDSKYVQVGRNDMKTLHHMVAAVGAVTSGETGFASGVSALAIMSALRHGGRHVGIDPFQGAYSYDGLRAANGYAAKKALTFRHINETASMAVAWLHTQRVCFDAFFIDDGHKFDDIIVCRRAPMPNPSPHPNLHPKPTSRSPNLHAILTFISALILTLVTRWKTYKPLPGRALPCI